MRTISFLLILALFLEGCIQLLAVRAMGEVMEYGLETFQEESDLELAESALGSNLKLLEALIKADPDNERLLFFACQGYSAYGLAFAEDDDPARAKAFYKRAREYGVRILDENGTFRRSREGDLESFTNALQSFSKDDLPAVFWTAFAWGSYVNLSRAETAALADIPKVNAMMAFVLNHDPSYYYGAAHVYFGTFLGSTPVMLGGKPDQSKEHFEKAIKLTDGKFLMTYVYYARSYAVQVQDQELFESLLGKVEETSVDILPEARLPNAVAKKKAAALLARSGELF